jgi:hypothetical protein
MRVLIPGLIAPMPAARWAWDRTLRVLLVWSVLLAVGVFSLLTVPGLSRAMAARALGGWEWSGVVSINTESWIRPAADARDGAAENTGGFEKAPFLLSGREAVVREGGEAVNVTITLTQLPTAPVSVRATETDASEVLASPHLLTFHLHDWSVPQNLSLVPVNDEWQDGDVRSTVRKTPSPSTATEDLVGKSARLSPPSRPSSHLAGLCAPSFRQVELRFSSEDETFCTLAVVSVVTQDAETCRDCLGTLESPMVITQLPFNSRDSTVGRPPSGRGAAQRSGCTRDDGGGGGGPEMVFKFVPTEDMQVYLSTCEVLPLPPPSRREHPNPNPSIFILHDSIISHDP